MPELGSPRTAVGIKTREILGRIRSGYLQGNLPPLKRKGKRWRPTRWAVTVICILCLWLDVGYAGDFTLTIAHMNDTHSHLDPGGINLRVRGETITAPVGGFARLRSVVKSMKRENPNLLILHAGDAVQGTPYFTFFDGSLEFTTLNMLDVDAMVMGNHEFDRGLGPIPRWIERSRFPWLGANIDVSQVSTLKGRVHPFIIKEIEGTRVGIIGVTTDATPLLALNVGAAAFLNPETVVRTYVKQLTTQGIRHIIVLSHLGYERDMALASQVAGIDLIVGGHSHSLLECNAELSSLGLRAQGRYPTEVTAPDGKKVLIVQAWQWGHAMGRIKATFTPKGEITEYTARVLILIGDQFIRHGKPIPHGSRDYTRIRELLARVPAINIAADDPEVLAELAPYRKRLNVFQSTVIAYASEPLERGVNRGLGPIIADAMRMACPDAQMALQHAGGIRRDLPASNITLYDVAEVLPFGNTLVVVELTGEKLIAALEGHLEFLFQRRGHSADRLPSISGMTMTVAMDAPCGERIVSVAVADRQGRYIQLKREKTYHVVVNSFLAAGGDGFSVLRTAAKRRDTGLLDREVFSTYLKRQGIIRNPEKPRISIRSGSYGKNGEWRGSLLESETEARYYRYAWRLAR